MEAKIPKLTNNCHSPGIIQSDWGAKRSKKIGTKALAAAAGSNCSSA